MDPERLDRGVRLVRVMLTIHAMDVIYATAQASPSFAARPIR